MVAPLLGGAEGIRTPGLVNASHALCQLSYSPVSNRLEMVRDRLSPCQGIPPGTPPRLRLRMSCRCIESH